MLIGAMVLPTRILPVLRRSRGARPLGPGVSRGEAPAAAPERPPLIAEEDAEPLVPAEQPALAARERANPLTAEEHPDPPVIANGAEPEQPRVGPDARRYPGSPPRERSVRWRWGGGRRLSRWARARQEARQLGSERRYDDSEMEHLVREQLYGPGFRRR